MQKRRHKHTSKQSGFSRGWTRRNCGWCLIRLRCGRARCARGRANQDRHHNRGNGACRKTPPTTVCEAVAPQTANPHAYTTAHAPAVSGVRQAERHVGRVARPRAAGRAVALGAVAKADVPLLRAAAVAAVGAQQVPGTCFKGAAFRARQITLRSPCANATAAGTCSNGAPLGPRQTTPRETTFTTILLLPVLHKPRAPKTRQQPDGIAACEHCRPTENDRTTLGWSLRTA